MNVEPGGAGKTRAHAALSELSLEAEPLGHDGPRLQFLVLAQASASATYEDYQTQENGLTSPAVKQRQRRTHLSCRPGAAPSPAEQLACSELDTFFIQHRLDSCASIAEL